jgi:predicted metal-dependent hydrolase
MPADRSPGGVQPLRSGSADGEDAGSAAGVGPVEVRRSRRRRRTVSAYREGERTVVLIPARFTKAEERHWVETMLGRLAAGDRRRKPSDAQLLHRATELSRRYLDGKARPSSVRWAGNQLSRWGSCTPSDGTIRISDRLKGMPGYVLDYVLLHELAHLLRSAHDREFWALLDGFPRLERARGYLEGYAAAGGHDEAGGADADDAEAADSAQEDADDRAHQVTDDRSARTTLF